MKKLGLALSGGGFRATLYHLGLVRFLRDANLLQNVSHITAVSGGSVIAAHLAMNWGRYTGSTSEFDAAAGELLDYVRLDVRNRIVRRFGLGFLVRWTKLFGVRTRRMSRTGLLEYMYEKHLFGDTSLFQLPESPSVHLLTTNISQGRLCSFNRNGLLVVRPDPVKGWRMDRMPVSLATVPMAVAASSAFPGFFPPLMLTGADIGASRGEFGRRAFTDGGVYDNLGVRMFRFLQQTVGPDEFPDGGILVSDVGRQFEVQSNVRASGMIRTAMRASDILMNRVWQLENEALQDSAGFVFARVTDTVEPHEDPTAPHPEVQRHLPNVRTDFDRFSAVEISNLIRHGYCVARKACRSAPEMFGTEFPDGPPWDPMQDSRRSPVAAAVAPATMRDRRKASADTREARTLHTSGIRRIWSTLLDWRDWVSWVYVPILIPIMVLLPYGIFKYHQRSQRVNQVMESLAQGSRDLEQMTRLMEAPVEPWRGVTAEELPANAKRDLTNFLILQDSRIIDLRRWKPSRTGSINSDSLVYGYRRLKVMRKPDAVEGGSNEFRVSVLATSPDTQVRFPTQKLSPKLYSQPLSNPGGGPQLRHFEVSADFSRVPDNESVDIVYEHQSPGLFLANGNESSSLVFEVEAETVELTRWLLLPEDKEYRDFQLTRYETANPGHSEKVNIVTQYLAEDSTLLAFKLLSLKAGYTYEMTWYYR